MGDVTLITGVAELGSLQSSLSLMVSLSNHAPRTVGAHPLCPVGHLPHKGGDQLSVPPLHNLKRFRLCKGVHVNVISPLVGEMSDRTEGGDTSTNIAVAEQASPSPHSLLRLAIEKVGKTGDPKGNAGVFIGSVVGAFPGDFPV
ncbi:hypothetical protein AB4Y96_11065 [Phyllobacterium sp. TAF24]|uniref:hypothetical protein n=1 Tax=Phyllobacterium sp. TAF24 TaxID=3233068 RepID=UPI003F998659